MAPSLLHPPSYLSPAASLQLSQAAPNVLKNAPRTSSSNPIQAIFSAPETADLWLTYENLLLSCLRTGDEQSAHECLDRLVARFGADNERVMAYQGLVKEAEANNNGELEKILHEYDAILSKDDTNVPIIKRRIALLRSLGRTSDAVAGLTALLDFSPTDAEGWSELSDMYYSQGLYPQAIYSLEEVLVLVPNAWNIHARMGELQHMAATASGTSEANAAKYLAESLKRFCRSIELCDDYLRGYYGLQVVTSRLLKEPAKSKQTDADDLAMPDYATIQRLNEKATAKLSEIVRRHTAKEPRWGGYEESEIAAAKELLSKVSGQVVR